MFCIYSDFWAIELSSYDTVRILQYSKSEFAREKRSNFCLQQFFKPSLALAWSSITRRYCHEWRCASVHNYTGKTQRKLSCCIFLKFRIYSDFLAIELLSYDTGRILQYSKSKFAGEKRSNFCLQQFFYTLVGSCLTLHNVDLSA